MSLETRPAYAHLKTTQFLDAVIFEAGKSAKNSDYPNPVSLAAAKDPINTNMAVIYYRTPRTQVEIGEKYGVTKQMVSLRIHKGMHALWQASPLEIRRQFPFNTIPLRKPIPTHIREQRSRKNGGLSAKVYKLHRQGLAADQIIKRLRITGTELGRTRQILMDWGATIEHLPRPQPAKELAQKIRQAADEGTLRKLFRSVNYYFYIHFTQGEQPLLTVLRNVAVNLTYAPSKTRLIARILIREGIPVGKLRHRFVREGHEYWVTIYYLKTDQVGQAREILETHPQLRQFQKTFL